MKIFILDLRIFLRGEFKKRTTQKHTENIQKYLMEGHENHSFLHTSFFPGTLQWLHQGCDNLSTTFLGLSLPLFNWGCNVGSILRKVFTAFFKACQWGQDPTALGSVLPALLSHLKLPKFFCFDDVSKNFSTVFWAGMEGKEDFFTGRQN